MKQTRTIRENETDNIWIVVGAISGRTHERGTIGKCVRWACGNRKYVNEFEKSYKKGG